MNTASAVVLGVIVVLAALSAWRVLKKGAPCECGGTRKLCSDGCGDCCCCKRDGEPDGKQAD